MAENLFLTDLNLNGNQLKGARVECLPEPPANPEIGRIYFNTTENAFYSYGSTGWKKGEVYAASNPAQGTTGAIGVYFGTENNTFKFRMLKSGDNYLTIAEGLEEGIIILGVDIAKLPVQPSVITKLEDYYTKTEVDAKISGIYKFKGSVDYFYELPNDPQIGDVWLVKYKGTEGQEVWSAEFAWVGDEWDELGSLVDLSAYEIMSADTEPSHGIQLLVDDKGVLHINAEGAQASWEAYGNQVLAAAKEYTDQKYQSAKEYSDNNLQQSKDYTDTKVVEEQQRSDQYAQDRLTEAKEYSDQKLQDAKDYTNDKVEDNSRQDRQYTDDAIQAVKEYTDARKTAVAPGDETIAVEKTTLNGKDTYNVRVSDSLMARINEMAGRGKAAFYSCFITVDQSSPYHISKLTHNCGTNLMVQATQNGTVIEVGITIEDGEVFVHWNGELGAAIQIMIFGISNEV